MKYYKEKFVLYVFNNENDYKRINSFYQTEKECLQDLQELNTLGTWLNKKYNNDFKYSIIFNVDEYREPIKNIICKEMLRLK